MEKDTGNLNQKKIHLGISLIASYDKADKRTTLQNVLSPKRYTVWVSGLLQFGQRSVAEVFRSIERYCNVEIEFIREVNFNQLISGEVPLNILPQK